MDESDGRAKAAALGLRPVGVLGVLLRAKLHRQILSVRETMERLRTEAGFFISAELFTAVLREAGEA
jgi:predicted nucleic acid-binding protein